jgi:DNA-binding protein HU-beta
MNKGELVEALAKEANISKSQANSLLNATLDVITKSLKKGEEVNLTGFGRFDISKRKAREGRNPQTGATIKIPARKVPRFKASKTLKEVVQ